MVLRQTKFLIPRVTAERMARPRALTLLRSALERKLALLVAPPGYGKTTLMAEAVAAEALPTLWVQLDEADNDPVTLVGYLVEGACRTLPALDARLRGVAGELLAGAGPRAAERTLVLLGNELLEHAGRPWLLALDDYHLIRNPAVHELVSDWLEAPPPGMRVMLASRSVPPLPLPRWRARGRLLELPTALLRFEPDEASRWLRETTPGLDERLAATLAARTEGWGAGLQLTASLLAELPPGGADTPPEAADDGSTRVSGAHPYLAGYLMTEVFERQPPELRHFLLASAVLPQLNGELCGELLGDPRAQEQLARLERAQLFLVPLDAQRRWYRYHGLFREFLLARLEADDPERLRRLRARAARILEAHGEPEAALRSHLENHDHDAAARLLATVGRTLLEHGRADQLVDALEQLGAATAERPELLLLHGRALRRLGRPAEATAHLEAAVRRALRHERDDLACAARSELASLLRAQGDYPRARAQAAAALAGDATDPRAAPAPPTPPEPLDVLDVRAARLSPAVRAAALMELAKNEGLLAGMDRGRALAERAVAAMHEGGADIPREQRAQLLRSLGLICWWHGDVAAAVDACERALALLPERESPLAAELHLVLAVPTLYRHEYDAALQHAETALALCQRLELRERLPAAYAVLGNTLTRLGRLERAEDCLRRAIEEAADTSAAYDRVMAAGYLAYNLQAQKRPDEAALIAETALWRHRGRPPVYEVYVCRSVLADCFVEAGRTAEAERIFRELVTLGEARQYRVPLAMAHFGLAFLQLRRGERDAGLASARRSLELLEPTRAWELYADQGARARPVCDALARALPADAPERAFVATVQRALRAAPPATGVVVRAADDARLRVRTLGGLEVIRDGRPLPARAWVSSRARDLLALFVTLRHEEVSLARAMEALWPDEPERDSAAFHTALYRLRGALRRDGDKSKFVVLRNKHYTLDTARFDLDADRFERLLARARVDSAEDAYREALELYRGDYLDAFEHAWLQPERARLRDLQLDALASLAALLERRGEVSEALALVRRLLRAEPLRESAHCSAMRLLHRLGDRHGVSRQYHLLVELLHDELAVTPLPATERLYRHLSGT